MPLSAVSVLVVAQSSSELPEGLMNNPVLFFEFYSKLLFRFIIFNSHQMQQLGVPLVMLLIHITDPDKEISAFSRTKFYIQQNNCFAFW